MILGHFTPETAASTALTFGLGLALAAWSRWRKGSPSQARTLAGVAAVLLVAGAVGAFQHG